ncbi:MAG: hypothetical protein K2N44_16860 [Lachnospiraceae bacterium]|nr:hypothetical protein [Lachnospiraceae bacterium]
MSEFIVQEEAFKLGLMERVPSPYEGECFLLYQTGGGEGNSFVVNSGVKYSSAQVRHGHYNRKVTFSLEEGFFSQDYQIVMADNDFFFHVQITISYTLQDVQKYFFQGQMDESDIQQILKNVIRGQDGKWNVQQGWEIRNILEDSIERKLKQYEGVKFKILELTVEPDEDAIKMIQSNREKTVGIHLATNKTDEKIAINEQNERIADSERTLTKKQIEEMAYMMKNFGNLGPIVSDYLKNGMNGVELYNYIMKAKTDNMAILNTAVSNDMLTQKEAFEKLNDILTNNAFLQSEYQQLTSKDGGRIEEKKEEGETGEEEAISPVDGDCI